MTWNHRILAFKQDVSGLPPQFAEKYKDEIDLRVCSVFYDDNGNPNGYAEAKPVSSDQLKGIKWILSKMKEATEKPILWAGDKFPQEFKPE